MLRWGIAVAVGLLLLTPLVVSTSTLFPFVVGKAVWSRSLIEIAFAFWAWLALRDPSARPPRSRLLLLLGAGLGVALLSAAFGVSWQRSVWSTYERMQGIVDLAHWTALAVVVGSVFRTEGAWRRLLQAQVGVGAVVTAIVLARSLGWEVPFYGELAETYAPRPGGPFGNPIYLSAYLLSNLTLAAGFAVSALGGERERALSRWPGALGWGAVAAFQFAAFLLADSLGGHVGLLTSLGFLLLALVWWSRARIRLAAAGLALALGAGAVWFGSHTLDPDQGAAVPGEIAVTGRIARLQFQEPSVQERLGAWRAGLRGFRERPVLGFGPDNFDVVFARFASGYALAAPFHDRAHSKLVGVAATTGTLGLLAYLSLWLWVFVLAWRSAAREAFRGRVLTVFVGAALAGAFVQSQVLFDQTTSQLQCFVLFGFLVHRERSLVASGRPLGSLAAALRRRAVRIALAAGIGSALALGLLANRAIWNAAGAIPNGAANGPQWASFAAGIAAFEPLANTYRWSVFDALGSQWPMVLQVEGPRVGTLLAWADREAEAALRSEPENWRLAQAAALMYRAAAVTHPAYAEKARHSWERTRDLAPERPVIPVEIGTPRPLAPRPLADGRHELRWRPTPDAGYHEIREFYPDGRRRSIHYAYDAEQSTFTPPPPSWSGPFRHEVRACRDGDCTAWVAWPGLPGEPPTR